MKTISLFLLFTLGSLQSYGPYARPWAGGDHSIAAAGGKALLAWSEEDAQGRARIHVVLLDSSGRAISPIRTLPVLTENRDALVPSVATNGQSFLVAWEEVLGMQHTVVMAVDDEGAPLGEPHGLTNDVPILSNAYEAPRITWNGTAYGVANSSNAYFQVSSDARSIEPAFANNVVRAEAVRTGVPCFLYCASPTTFFTTVVRWTVGSRLYSQTLGNNVDVSTPDLAPAGDRWAIVWTTNDTLWVRFSDQTSTHTWNVDADQYAHPQIACGATHCVVAYATRGSDIAGFVFDQRQPSVAPTPFIAAASAATEREPQVAMVSNARALITWRSTEADGEHLTGRPLTLPSKQRAVR